MDDKAENRFWSKVSKPDDPDACWLWQAGRTDGYGMFFLDRKHVLAHRISYVLVHGAIPDGMCVCHACDNPRCVNPKHLFLGTVADNNADMVAKGRNSRPPTGVKFGLGKRFLGMKNGRAKLSDEQVMSIRSRRSAGEPVAEIARDFQVSIGYVYKIAVGSRR